MNRLGSQIFVFVSLGLAFRVDGGGNGKIGMDGLDTMDQHRGWHMVRSTYYEYGAFIMCCLVRLFRRGGIDLDGLR